MSTVTYGLLRRDGLLLALPLEVLREVLPLPEQLDPLPHDIDGVVGAHVLRGRVVPVVDLSAVVRGTSQTDQPQILAVLRHGTSVLAVVADNAEGIVTVEQGTQTRMADGDRAVSSVVFTHPGADGVVSVLDVATLFRRYREVAVTVDPAVDTDAVHGSMSATGTAGATGELPVLMATCDDLGLGLPIRSVDGMQTTSTITGSALTGGACLGVIAYRGVEVPLVDPLQLLGLGRTTVQPINECLVLSLAGGFVALLISSVVQLHHVDPAAVQPLPRFGIARPEALRGLWDGGDVGRFLLVDQHLLDTDEELHTLARMNHPVTDVGAARAGAGAGQAGAARAGAGRAARRSSRLAALGIGVDGDPVGDASVDGGAADGVVIEDDQPQTVDHARTYVTFVAGIDWATPLETVEAIVDPPADLVVYDSTAPWMKGLFDHRGVMIPLVELSTVMDQPAAAATGPTVIVMRSPAGTVGFLVDRLLSIESSSRMIPGREDGPSTPRDLDSLPFAMIGPDEQMVPVVDLLGLCHEVAGGALVG